MNKYLANYLNIDELTEKLTNPNSEIYFAKQENKLIGSLKINFGRAQTELRNQHAVEIERIYIMKKKMKKMVKHYLIKP